MKKLQQTFIFISLLYLYGCSSNTTVVQENGCISGNCLNGKGVRIKQQHTGYYDKYEGIFKNGKYDGIGKLERYDKSTNKAVFMYEGSYKKGTRHGAGKYTDYSYKYGHPNREEGTYENGVRSGLFTRIYHKHSTTRLIDFISKCKYSNGKYHGPCETTLYSDDGSVRKVDKVVYSNGIKEQTITKTTDQYGKEKTKTLLSNQESTSLSKKVKITYLPVSNKRKISEALSDSSKQNGIAATALFAYIGTDGYVVDKEISLIPVVQNKTKSKLKISFETTMKYTYSAYNSMLQYTASRGKQTSDKEKTKRSVISVDPYSVTKGDKISFGVLRTKEKVSTFIADIEISRKITGFESNIISIEK